MSGQGGLWLWVCSLYATLLTLTVLCVAILLRKHRTYSKSYKLPQASFHAIESKSEHQPPLYNRSRIIEEVNNSWKNFDKEFSSCSDYPANSKAVVNDLDIYQHQIHVIKPIDVRPEHFNFTDDEISVQNDEFDQESAECFEIDIKEYCLEANYCSVRASKLDVNLISSDPRETFTNSSSDKLTATDKKSGQVNSSNSVKTCSSEETSVIGTRYLNADDNSYGESDIDQLSEADSEVANTHLIPTKVLSSAVNRLMTDDIIDCQISMSTADSIKGSKELEKLELELNSDTILSDNNSKIIDTQKDFPIKVPLEKFNEMKIISDGVSADSKTLSTPSNKIQDLIYKSQDDKRNTVVYEDEDGNISITQLVYTEMMEEDGKPVPTKKRTCVYETETGTISLTQIFPDTGPLIKNKKFASNTDSTENGLTEIVVPNIVKSNTNVLNDDEKTKNEVVEDIGKLISMELSELVYEKIEKDEDALAENATEDITTSIKLPEEMDSNNLCIPANKSKYNTQVDKYLVEKLRNKSVHEIKSLTSITTKDTDKETQSVGSGDEVQMQCSCRDGNDKVDIVSEQSNIDMSRILLAGLDTTQNINNNETDATSNTMIKLNKRVLPEIKTHEYQTAAKPVAKDNSVTLNYLNHADKPEIFNPVQQCEFITSKQDEIVTSPENIIIADVNRSFHSIDIVSNLSKLDTGRTDVSVATIQFEDTENRSTDEIITLENLIRDTQRNLNQLISHLKKDNQVKSNSSLKTCALKPISEDEVLDTSEKANSHTCEDGRHCHDLIVYQTVTETSGPKSDMLEQEMALAAVNKVKMESSASENIIDADYVTVRHRLPIPASKINFNYDIDNNNFRDLSDAKIEIVDIGCSHSKSPSIDSCPNCQHLDSKTNEHSDSSYSEVDGTVAQTESVVSEIPKTVEKSILDDLLYMGERSESYIVDRRATIPNQINNECNGNNCDGDSSTESNDTLFYITRDNSHSNRSVTSGNFPTDVPIGEAKEVSTKPSNNIQPLMQTKFSTEIKEQTKDLPESYHDYARSIKNRHFERVVSGNVEEIDHRRNSRKNADNTKELLEMLATFTNREEANCPTRDPSAMPGTDYEDLTPERLVSSPRVQSMVFSKENSDNLPTIIEHPQINDATDAEYYDDFDFDSMPERIPRIKTSQGTKAMKTLRFDLDDVDVDNVDVYEDKLVVNDDNVYVDANDVDVYDDYSTNSPMVFTNPLRKTFGEPSFMNEDHCKKSHVIPTYLKDVSDGIKALMLDLTKPMTDVVPFGTRVTKDRDQNLRQTSSTNSSEAQANLFTSSQVDLQPTRPYVIVPGRKLKPIIKQHYTRCSEYYNSSTELSYNVESNKSSEYDIRENGVEFIAPDSIQFDPTNPLNNVLLPPIDFNVHKYSPIERDHVKTESSFESYHKDDDNAITQYSILHAAPYYPTSSDVTFSNTENPNSISRLVTIEESVETPNEINKHEEMNTVITMQDNQKLLDGSSSLTLVETHSVLNWATNVQCAQIISRGTFDKIPLDLTGSKIKVIYKQDLNQSPKLNDDVGKKVKMKTQCPHKTKTNSSPVATDVMPIRVLTSSSTVLKTVSKSSKHSTAASTVSKVDSNATKSVYKSITSKSHDGVFTNNRCSHKTDLKASKEEMRLFQEIDLKPTNREKKRRTKSATSDKSKTKSGCRNHSSNLIVQQAITEYKQKRSAQEYNDKTDKDAMLSDGEINYIDVCESNRTKADTATSKGEINYTNVIESRSWDSLSETTDMGDSLGATMMGKEMDFAMDWQPELLNELSSKNLVTECDSRANVVENIDLLPFMGSDECAWVSSSQREWVFRLMQGRLRMVVSLAHTKLNQSDLSPAHSGDCVRADTPISAISMEATESTKNLNAVAELSIRFALGAMHYFVGQSSLRAGDVPALLRRCAAVARIALRWHAAMYDSWLHLGFILDSEGWLSLNVTNIPLRSVWCVTMKIDLVEDYINEVPWPHASDVKVTTLVAFADVTPGDVAIVTRGISADWGHAPRTLWRMVRYLRTLPAEESQRMNSPASVTYKQ